MIATETQEQIKLLDLIKIYTDLPFIHIPNQRRCSPIYGRLLKRMGVVRGVSDIFIPRKTIEGKLGTFIELKNLKGKLTKYQSEFIDSMKKEGYEAKVCYGAEEAMSLICKIYYTSFKRIDSFTENLFHK